MNGHFPAVTAKQVIRALRRAGFELLRHSSGSHAVYIRESDSRKATVPMHGSRILRRGTLSRILDDAGLTVEEFRRLLRGR